MKKSRKRNATSYKYVDFTTEAHFGKTKKFRQYIYTCPLQK